MSQYIGAIDQGTTSTRFIIFDKQGSIAYAGALVQWIRDNLGLIKNASDIEDLAKGVKDNADVYCVPAFSGLSVGFWTDLNDLKKNWAVQSTFPPQKDKVWRENLYSGWQKAVKRTLNWTTDHN